MLKLTTVFLIVTVFVTGTLYGQTLTTVPKTQENHSNLNLVIAGENERIIKESSILDLKKLEKSQRKVPKYNWTKKEKTFLILGIIGTAVLVFLVIKYGKECVRYENNCNPSEDGCYCAEYKQNN
jgi:hypothetical protein